MAATEVLTLREELINVQQALVAIERGAQEYTIDDGKKIVRADLATLYAREKYLLAAIAEEEAGDEYHGLDVTFAATGTL